MKSSSGGVGIGTVLFLIFLTLKLCHVIAWSWWWVFAPVWIPVALIVLCLAVVGLALASDRVRR